MWFKHAPELLPIWSVCTAFYCDRHMNFETGKHSMFVLETWSKRAWNVIQICLKCDPNMLQNCFKCDRHTWILKLGNTACLFLKRAWNVIQMCLKCAWNVIQTCLKWDPNMLQNCNFRNRVTQHVCSWNMLEIWSKHAQELL
jgi:hypothetical protein